MRVVTTPTDAIGSHQAISERLQRLASSKRLAYLRVLRVRKDSVWHTACGRIDVCREDHIPKTKSRPLGQVHLLEEIIPVSQLAERLEVAMGGGDFLVSGERFLEHGLAEPWTVEQHCDDWANYGTVAPFFQLAPRGSDLFSPHMYETLEGEGEIEAFDGFGDCAREVLGFLDARDSMDLRLRRFQVIEWDYRGVFVVEDHGIAVQVIVTPSNHKELTMSATWTDSAGRKRGRFPGPATVELDVEGQLRRLSLALRRNGELVCENLFDAAYFALAREHWPEADTEPLAQSSTVVESVLPFMQNASLAEFVARDLNELAIAERSGAVKSSLLLAGSILETLLLDVLGRNPKRVGAAMPRKWPERASLGDLLRVCGQLTVDSGGVARPLLSALIVNKATIVTEHRDLIHPRAEIRAGGEISIHTVKTMHGLLGEVIEELRRAHDEGLLQSYADSH